ncbi:hypothetical protein F4859DRAFT_135862 [Xylaria cf. heliscus]|nr:hypothetical protein F4859DRAFT_135862 [Xylaria cf. heliscus]
MYMSTTSSLRSHSRAPSSSSSSSSSSHESARPTLASTTAPSPSPAKADQKSYASFSWANITRKRGIDGIADIQAPKSPSYNLAFGGKREKDPETEDQENVEFASDIDINIKIADFKPRKEMGGSALSTPRADIRLVPRTGRTVYVKNNVDVARSFKLLAVQIAQNAVRRDFYAQRFHERPGKKRKRLRSERWQRRFQKGFKATISRVRELTAQGW